jgi:hypothetical protein
MVPMVSHSEVDGAVIRDIQNYKNGAYTLIFSIFFASAAIAWSMLKHRLIPPAIPSELPGYVCRLILLPMVIVLILRWIAASISEFSLWITYLVFRTPRSQVFLSMFGLSFILGMMSVATLLDFPIFAAYMSGYLAFNLWTQWIFNSHYARVRARTSPQSAEHKLIVAALDRYWLRRPQLGRIAAMLLFTVNSLTIWLATANHAAWAFRGKLGAQILIILTLLIGEAVISVWRWIRDEEIERAARRTPRGDVRTTEP